MFSLTGFKAAEKIHGTILIIITPPTTCFSWVHSYYFFHSDMDFKMKSITGGILLYFSGHSPVQSG